MSLGEYLVRNMGVYGYAMIAVTAAYAALFANAAWDLAVLARTKPGELEKRGRERKLIRFFTACSDVAKLATIGGFFMTLVGFQQVIEGFRSVDKNLALSGMTTAVLSSACYVPIIAFLALWMLLIRLVFSVRPEISAFLWKPTEDKPA